MIYLSNFKCFFRVFFFYEVVYFFFNPTKYMILEYLNISLDVDVSSMGEPRAEAEAGVPARRRGGLRHDACAG